MAMLANPRTPPPRPHGGPSGPSIVPLGRDLWATSSPNVGTPRRHGIHGGPSFFGTTTLVARLIHSLCLCAAVRALAVLQKVGSQGQEGNPRPWWATPRYALASCLGTVLVLLFWALSLCFGGTVLCPRSS